MKKIFALLLIFLLLNFQPNFTTNNNANAIQQLYFNEEEPFTIFFAAASTMPIDSRLLWFGGDANIPNNWSRDTNFNDRFIQDTNTGFLVPVNGGGSHTHTDSNHTHTGNAHDHNVSAGNSNTYTTILVNNPGSPTPATRAVDLHSQLNGQGTSTTIVYDANMFTIDSNSAIPPYITAIIIKPNDALQSFPAGAVAFYDFPTPPTGFNISNGSNGTTDLNNFFILGASDANGGDRGGTATHGHTIPTHDHNTINHLHAAFATSVATPVIDDPGNVLFPGIEPNIHHTHNLLTTVAGRTAMTSTLVTDFRSSEPAYIKLLAVKNTSGAGSTSFDGIIVPFVGSVASIPLGWEIVDSNKFNRQIKITTNIADVNKLDGNNFHFHGYPHGHIMDTNHNHLDSVTSGQREGYVVGNAANSALLDAPGHFHGSPAWTVTYTTPTLQDANVNIGVSDKRYNYREVILIKKSPSSSCTYGGGTWVIDCADGCFINSNVDLNSNGVVLINDGNVDLNGTLQRVDYVDFPQKPKYCTLKIWGGNSIEFN